MAVCVFTILKITSVLLLLLLAFPRPPCVYTLGPVLRIADIKNMGRNFAPEGLRIFPWGPWGHNHMTTAHSHKRSESRPYTLALLALLRHS